MCNRQDTVSWLYVAADMFLRGNQLEDSCVESYKAAACMLQCMANNREAIHLKLVTDKVRCDLLKFLRLSVEA